MGPTGALRPAGQATRQPPAMPMPAASHARSAQAPNWKRHALGLQIMAPASSARQERAWVGCVHSRAFTRGRASPRSPPQSARSGGHQASSAPIPASSARFLGGARLSVHTSSAQPRRACDGGAAEAEAARAASCAGARVRQSRQACYHWAAEAPCRRERSRERHQPGKPSQRPMHLWMRRCQKRLDAAGSLRAWHAATGAAQ